MDCIQQALISQLVAAYRLTDTGRMNCLHTVCMGPTEGIPFLDVLNIAILLILKMLPLFVSSLVNALCWEVANAHTPCCYKPQQSLLSQPWPSHLQSFLCPPSAVWIPTNATFGSLHSLYCNTSHVLYTLNSLARPLIGSCGMLHSWSGCVGRHLCR